MPEFDYALNPYRGCVHGCVYCYAPNLLRIPRHQWGTFVEVKRNIPNLLAKELKTKKKGVVGISTTTDPYQAPEKKYKITRYCLEQLQKHDFPASILTKSPLVTRDIDILSNFKEIEVGLTLTTGKDSERSIAEPHAPSIDSRMEALKSLSSAGIATYAFLGPLYPTIDEEELRSLIARIKNAGCKRISSDKLNIRPGIPHSISEAFREYPKKERLWSKSMFGDATEYLRLFSILEEVCRQEKISCEFQKY